MTAVTVTGLVLAASHEGGGEDSATREAYRRGAPNGTPAVERVRLCIRWQARARHTRLWARWRPGGGATLAGRLTSPTGPPVADARIDVLAADAARPGLGSRNVGEVVTDRDGHFQATIALHRGAPRKLLSFSYLARARDTVPAARAHAELRVYGPISIDEARPARRGSVIRLRGRSAPGAEVKLLIRSAASRSWQPVDHVSAGGDGRWRAALRTPHRPRGRRFVVRARVAASRARGYLAATSPPRPIGIR